MSPVLQYVSWPHPIWIVIGGATLAYLVLVIYSSSPLSKYPLFKSQKWYDLLGFQARMQFILNGPDLVAAARKSFSGQAFRMRDPWGEILVLPAEHAHYLRSHAGFAFELFFNSRTHAALNEGFAGFLELARLPNIVSEGVKYNLTHVSDEIKNAVSEETALALDDMLATTHATWEEFCLSDTICRIVHRVSSRTFLGHNAPRNAEWLELAQNYTPDCSFGGFILDLCPPFLRPLVQWLIPAVYRCRRQLKTARRLITGITEERRRQAMAKDASVQEKLSINDAIGWFEKTAGGNSKLYDPAAAQLALTFVADHTSANFVMVTLLDLSRHTDVIESLRHEIGKQVNEAGWTDWNKTNIQNLRLLDSVIKESMRLRPIFFTAMLGGVLQEMALSDGTILPVGTRIAVLGDGNRDPAVYDKPDEWDGFRYYKMRQTGDREDMAQLPCATVEHAGFGVGKHSCPGRFYASDLIKIILCHILMKYDWKVVENGSPEMIVVAWTQMVHPDVKILFKRR